MDCKECKTRHRADKLIEDTGVNPAGWSFEQMQQYINRHDIACPDCGKKAFYGYPQVQPYVQNIPGRYGGRAKPDFPASRNRSGHIVNLSQFSGLPVRKSRSASDR